MLYKLKEYRKEIVCDLIGKLERLQSDQIQNQGVIGKIDKEIADLSAKNLVMTRLHTSGALNEADYAQRFTEICLFSYRASRAASSSSGEPVISRTQRTRSDSMGGSSSSSARCQA